MASCKARSGTATLSPPPTPAVLLASPPGPVRPSFPHPGHLLSFVVVVVRSRGPTFWQAYKNKTGTLSGPLQWLLSICSLHPPPFSVSLSHLHPFSYLLSSSLCPFPGPVPSPLPPPASRVPLGSSCLLLSRFLSIPFCPCISPFDSSVKPCLTVICSHIVSTILSRRMEPRKRMCLLNAFVRIPVPIRIPVVASPSASILQLVVPVFFFLLSLTSRISCFFRRFIIYARLRAYLMLPKILAAFFTEFRVTSTAGGGQILCSAASVCGAN